MRKITLSDKQKLIIIVSLLLSLGFVVTAVVNYSTSKAAIRESIVANELPLTADNIYSELQKDLIRPIFISSMMASDTFLRDWVLGGEKDVGQMTKYLREIKDRYHTFTSFFVSESGVYYHADGVLKTINPGEPRDRWYYRVRDMKSPYEINLDPDQANKDALTIFINFRVFDYRERFIGVAGVGLTVEAVRGLINDYQKRYQRTIYFVDPQGAIMMVGGESKMQGTNIRSIGGMGALADKILQKAGGSFQYENQGKSYLLNVRYIPELNWYLFAEKNEDVVLADIRHTLYSNLALALAVTGIVLLLTSLTINRYQKRLVEMATTDKLTGLSNRQAFEILVRQMLLESERNQTPLTALLIDIDHFKKINDSHGHLFGDKVLQHVAGTIKGNLRLSDIICRWGGEEFLIVLKECGKEEGLKIAEKIRLSVKQAVFRQEGAEIALTVSVGVSSGLDEELMLAQADRALYEAKRSGRDQVRA